MSHLSRIDISITDLSALKDACKRLGLEFKENQTSFKWYGQENAKCDHAIHVPNARYEIGVTKNGKSFELQWDNYQNGGLEKILGKSAGKLKQAYAVSKGILAAKKQGFLVREEKVLCQMR